MIIIFFFVNPWQIYTVQTKASVYWIGHQVAIIWGYWMVPCRLFQVIILRSNTKLTVDSVKSVDHIIEIWYQIDNIDNGQHVVSSFTTPFIENIPILFLICIIGWRYIYVTLRLDGYPDDTHKTPVTFVGWTGINSDVPVRYQVSPYEIYYHTIPIQLSNDRK